MLKHLKSSKPTILSYLGITLIFFTFLIPILPLASWALVATLVGADNKLETDTGGWTALGTLAWWLPTLIGVGLIAGDLILKPKINPKTLNALIAAGISAAGLLMGIAGMWSLSHPNPGDVGANIGGGILALTGVVFIVAGVAFGVAAALGKMKKPAKK